MEILFLNGMIPSNKRSQAVYKSNSSMHLIFIFLKKLYLKIGHN